MDGTLYCNLKTCHIPLSSEAWITSCSHLFCSKHVPSASESGRKCPCCLRDLRERKDVYKRNLNPDDAFKSVVLAGLSPMKIIEIGFKALEFLNFQSFHEKTFLQSYIKRQHLKLAKAEVERTEAETSYQTTIDNLKDLIQQHTSEYEKLQRELSICIRKTQHLEEKNQEKNKMLHKILTRHEAQRHVCHAADQPRSSYRNGYPMFSSQQAPPSTGFNLCYGSKPNRKINANGDGDRLNLSQNF